MFQFIVNGLMVSWFALPFLAFVVNAIRRRPLHPFFLFAMTVVTGFILLVAGAWASEAHLKTEMNRYDLDGDGGIGGSELTPDAEKAIDDWASDTGRTMVVFTGIPLTAIWTGMCFILLYVGKLIVTKAISSRSAATQR